MAVNQMSAKSARPAGPRCSIHADHDGRDDGGEDEHRNQRPEQEMKDELKVDSVTRQPVGVAGGIGPIWRAT